MLRVLPVAFLLLAAVPLPTLAQDAAAALLEDPAGDAALTVQDAPVPAAGGAAYPSADLRSLTIAEARSDLTFILGVEKLASGQDLGADGVVHEILFRHNGRDFRLAVTNFLPALSGPLALLDYRDAPDSAWSGLAQYRVRSDAAANTMAVDVARDHLADADGAAPFPGRVLEQVHVVAHSAMDGLFFVDDSDEPAVRAPQRVADAMPDDPAAAAAFPIALGVQQTGDARLSSTAPFRASNGEATTFVYEVEARNVGESEDIFELVAVSVPTGYALVLPVPVIKLDSGNTTTVPVLLTLPFGHQHGSVSSFVLEMRSLSDPGSIGRLEMGVRHLEIPQPAGHHDTVYLHTQTNEFGIGPLLSQPLAYMNTLEQDPRDLGGNAYATGFGGTGVLWFAWWTIPLSPALQLGLDVDPAKESMLRLPIGSTLPALQASVTVRLFVAPPSALGYYPEGSGETIASGDAGDPVDLGPNGEHLFEVALVPEERGGRYPTDLGYNLWLDIAAQFTGPAAFGLASESVYIAPGGSARLPLREYHDTVDDVLSAAGGPALSALDAQERRVNPGEAVVFPVTVANPLEEAVTVRFEVSGSNVEWASLPSTSVSVPAHGTAQASVVVRAPPGAVDLERADLVLQAYDEDRPEARGLLRLVAEVDTKADHVDDTAVATSLEAKDSPAPQPALLLAGLAAATALAVRRRR